MIELNIMNIGGVDCYEKDGTVYLKLETVARGLGFTETAASGNECVRWRTVRKYLSNLGIATCCDEVLPDYIPENIFYRLAMKAKNEAAEAFQAKIADEVIPSIRKHGAYMTPETLEKAILNPSYLLKVVTALKEETDKRVALENKVEADAPKVLFADAVSASHTSILVGELAKLLKQNGIDIGQNRLFGWLRDNGYLIKRKGRGSHALFLTGVYCRSGRKTTVQKGDYNRLDGAFLAVLEDVEKVNSGRTGNFKFVIKKRLQKSCEKVVEKQLAKDFQKLGRNSGYFPARRGSEKHYEKQSETAVLYWRALLFPGYSGGFMLLYRDF